MLGMPNEGDEKLFNIQQAIGRTPIFAAGNSAGDAPMLDLVQHVDGPSLALLIDHDDNDREIAYESIAASFDDGHNIVHVAERSGWLVASIRNDWVTVF